MNSNYDEYVEKLVNSGKHIVKNWIDGETQTVSSWIKLGSSLAEIIDRYDDISGVEKKSMVIKSIIIIIEDPDIIKNLDNSTRENLVDIIKLTLPTTLDLIIKATQGEIKINKKCKFLCFECTGNKN